MCPSGAVLASWSPIQEITGQTLYCNDKYFCHSLNSVKTFRKNSSEVKNKPLSPRKKRSQKDHVNIAVAYLRSKILDAPPSPRGPNSFNFMQFLGKFGKIVCWHPPESWHPQPRGNPGSANVYV